MMIKAIERINNNFRQLIKLQSNYRLGSTLWGKRQGNILRKTFISWPKKSFSFFFNLNYLIIIVYLIIEVFQNFVFKS